MGQSKKMKEILCLSKNIASFSDGQAAVLDMAEDCLDNLIVRIKPNGGLYMGGTFDFEINLESYPNKPSVRCVTKIYHPNIDCMEEEDNVCLNILDADWSDTMTLEDVVHGFLFLLYNPNLEDPLSPLFDSETSYEEFAENVAKSLKGAEIEDFKFDFNFYSDLEDGVANKANNCDEEIINKEIITDSAKVPEPTDDSKPDIEGVDAVHDDTKDVDSTNEARSTDIPPAIDRQTSKVDMKIQIDCNTLCENCRVCDTNNTVDTDNNKISKTMAVATLFNDNLMPEINMVTKLLPKFLDRFLCCVRTMKTKDDV